MAVQSQREEFNHFIERMAKIRDLSSPALYDFDDADDYSRRLRKNFETIGKLAAENRRMLDEILYPILHSDKPLTDDEIENMGEFGEKLLSMAGENTDFENLDVPIMALVTDRLLDDAEKKKDICNEIRQMDASIEACYSLMNMTARISTAPSISEGYQKRGFEIGSYFLNLLKKENFLSIPDLKLRELVLTDARFASVFYECSQDEKLNQDNINLLEHMLRIAEDPFYAKAAPEFDWRYFKFRVYQYFLQCTDNGNIRGFHQEQLERFADIADEFEAFLRENEGCREFGGAISIPILCYRNRYLAGRIKEAEYRRVLLDIYEGRDPDNFGVNGNFENVLVPLELMALIDKKRSAKDKELLKRLYQNLSAYAFQMPNAGALSYVLEYFIGVINRFYEVPSIISFEEFCLQTLAAIHPPTYVHSLMVGKLVECICIHLIRQKPEILVGTLGCESVEQVIADKDRITNFAYHAAICHDFGKIMIIDTILVYGRHLMNSEFDIIKTHPKMGAELLRRHESTKEFADIALGHHRFHDDSRGYPEEFNTKDSPLKVIIDLVMCADCLDAATDTVGRSYSRGKTLTEFVEELKEESGTRYASWLAELFEEDALREDIRFLLSEGREATYHDTYILLKGVKERVKG